MGRNANHAIHYLLLACMIAGFVYELPMCWNMAIGLLIGMSIACTIVSIENSIIINRETEELKDFRIKSELLRKYSRKHRTHDSETPDCLGCNEQTKSCVE